ncbi:MAG: hypothetical protein CBE33_01080 [Candidatus Pelagibacter sp. TMED273]|nr:MAG: hypothetical protein CBE33_01080 [Candidatus Pelagibacter sp. TMED273]|tara:strand:- start:5364 stop:6437 length:1074 start_codon:yes stop_codon:yes gene_type:complete
MFLKKLNPNFFFNYLFIQVLVHIVYKVTFLDQIEGHFNISKNLFNEKSSLTQFFIESPLLLILGNVLNIETLDRYLIITYLFTQFFILLICIELDFLGDWSSLFLISGWVVTISWFVGYVDILSVYILIIICKKILKNNVDITLSLLFLILTLNHYAIALFSVITIGILYIHKNLKNYLIFSITPFIFGFFIMNRFLNHINFSGRSRIRFIFNDGILQSSVEFISSNFLEYLWSGFLGLIFLFLYLLFKKSWSQSRQYLISLLLMIGATSLGLDTSRIFSILLVPLTIKVIYDFKNSELTKNINSKLVIFISTISTLFFQERYVYGKVNIESPNTESKDFYELIPQIVNSVFSNIWS